MSYADRLRTTNLQAGRDADAQIAALTERLRAVEAERDALREKALRWYRADGTYETCANEADVIERRKAAAVTLANISALRAELQRKDAALRKVLPWLERETPPQYVGVNSEGLPVEYEPTAAEEACGMAAMVILEALQPKEPSCPTA